jgi:hypothetical protein
VLGLTRWPPWSAPLHTAQRKYKVEILKFAEPPKRSSRTNAKKRGGIMPLLAVVVSVAVVGGMSTTLAGTISLNTSNSVEFGQGVVSTAACDTTIKIIPASSFDTSTSTFSVSTVTLSDIGISGDTATVGGGCLGKKMTLRAYTSNGTPLDVNNAQNVKFVSITIPATAALANDKTNYVVTGDFTIPDAKEFAGNTGATGSGAGSFQVGNLKIPGSVTRITLESSEA